MVVAASCAFQRTIQKLFPLPAASGTDLKKPTALVPACSAGQKQKGKKGAVGDGCGLPVLCQGERSCPSAQDLLLFCASQVGSAPRRALFVPLVLVPYLIVDVEPLGVVIQFFCL